MTAVGSGTANDRAKAREAWESWWKTNRDKIDLAKIQFEEAYQGLTVVAELENRVWECSSDGTKRWEVAANVSRPIDIRPLPGGRILVAEHGANRVTERDRTGNILWEYPCQAQPVVCQRLPSGNTFIATYYELLEVTPDKKQLYSHKTQGMIYHAEKQRDGSMVYVTSTNQVVELDATGRQVRTVATPGTTSGWASVERLTNGNYLVALYSANRVVEIDATGKEIWEVKDGTKRPQSPGHATRLRNGHTLVASIEGRKVIEYDRDGKEVWSVAAPGRPFHAWRR
jgi:outer membrane protein assembly factor BamB